MKFSLILLLFLMWNCNTATDSHGNSQSKIKIDTVSKSKFQIQLHNITNYDSSIKYIHVFVALCDNINQGIIRVPEKIGNGHDPENNLYWGCKYGVKTFFKNSNDWTFLKEYQLDSVRLQRLVFRHKEKKYILIADAYDGRYIKNAIVDFLNSASGSLKDTFQLNNQAIGINGNADLISYIGHDGLMEFDLKDSFKNADKKQRDCVILACSSHDFFGPYLRQTSANPLLWTASLMCPEAYTLHDAIHGWINQENDEKIRERGVDAYAKYQHISKQQARSILISGW